MNYKSFDRQPDFEQFLRVLKRERRPDRLPFYEHIASEIFIACRTNTPFDRLAPDHPDYWRIYVDFWMGMGFDEVPMEIPLNCPLGAAKADDKDSVQSEARAVIQTMEDFERYPWPDEDRPIDFEHFDRVADILPEGAKIVGGVCAGPFEWVSAMMGVQGLSLALFMDPDLVKAMFDRIHRLHTSAVKRIADMDAVGALRQGDDLGFKTATFLSPEHLRAYVFPIYTDMVQAAHDAGKPFILHSCGNLEGVYEDIIDGCKIDAKHSFEDVIMPVAEFKNRYGSRVTPLGGLDVDRLCQGSETEIREYARTLIDACFEDGYWAFGTGNSLTNYMPVENYLIAIDEAIKYCG